VIRGGDYWPCLQYPNEPPPGPQGVISGLGQEPPLAPHKNLTGARPPPLFHEYPQSV
jgi:hypothetical protein